MIESIVLILSSTLSLGAALIKNVDRFAKVSILSNFIAGATLVAIIYCSITEARFKEGVQRSQMVENVSAIPETIGILATTYVYTQITLQLFYSLKKPSLKTWHKAEFCGMTVVIILNIAVGGLGYFAFKGKQADGRKVADNILQNFDPKNVIITVCRIGYAISILLTFPMQMLSGRKSAAFLYNFSLNRNLDQELSGIEFRLITIAIWIISIGVGIYAVYYGLGPVLSVGGCFVGTYMGFILPAACYLWSKSSKTVISSTLKPLEKVIAETEDHRGMSIVSDEDASCSKTKDIETQTTNKTGEKVSPEPENQNSDEDKVIIPDEMVPDDTWYDQFGAWCLFIIGFILMFGATGISVYAEAAKRN